jgi:hypothetical protein
VPGYYRSSDLRDYINTNGRETFVDDLRKTLGGSFDVTNVTIDSLKDFDDPIGLNYDLQLHANGQDLIYFNPMLTEAFTENPFKSAQRSYPVEIPYIIDKTYLLRLDVPKGYVVEELPSQVTVKLNPDEDGVFEYRVTESNGTISLRSRLRMRRTFFQPEDYENLRAFFSMIVKKHNEQIVFRKSK